MIIIMGVSGSGKTSIGKTLSLQTGWAFYDGDDFHPQSNKDKMEAGEGLTDSDRIPWLKQLAINIEKWSNDGEAILACSALKESYREILAYRNKSIKWVYLDGSFEQIKERLSKRENHFFDPKLLQSQFDVLEVPSYALSVKINQPIEKICNLILDKIPFIDKSIIGVIGMGVMGQGIALNLAENKFEVSVYNRITEGEENIISDFLSANSSFQNISGFTELSNFILALKRPRRIWLMVKSGEVIDILIQMLLPFLQKGDIIIDGGNSHYLDTDRRVEELQEKGVHFAGCGVSGGELGARHGASLMFGGSSYAYEQMSPFLKSIAAKSINEKPCEAYIGTGGAGHFIKMVHNGIEYAEMQLLAEIFAVLSKQFSYPEIVSFFKDWGKGKQASYLLKITANILQEKEGSQYLVDLILDQASSKGTGMWSSKAALTLGGANTLMTSAVFARYLSSIKKQRVTLSNYKPKKISTKPIDINTIEQALYFARLINHIQGFNLIQKAAAEYGWEYNPSQISSVWMEGCIIKSKLMQQLTEYFKEEKSLLDHPTVLNIIAALEKDTAALIHHAVDNKVALDTFSSSYNYWLSLCTETLPANLIQAQRDFFGAHTYQRIDKPKSQFFHTNWTQDD